PINDAGGDRNVRRSQARTDPESEAPAQTDGGFRRLHRRDRELGFQLLDRSEHAVRSVPRTPARRDQGAVAAINSVLLLAWAAILLKRWTIPTFSLRITYNRLEVLPVLRNGKLH